MAGYYELKRSGEKGYMFNLKAGNNETILTSQIYAAKDGAQVGILSVQANSPLDEKFERKVAKDDSAFFVLTAANGQTIGTSEMYSSPSDRDKGIESVRANGGTKTIKEVA
jgi:uncharacterized protein YegP (UPF0339 family)